jgi:signal peptidase
MKVSNTTSTVFYVILGIVLAFGINQGLAFALGTDMPVVAVESNSMVPTFHKGDLLILQGMPFEELEINDIIVFIQEGTSTAIVHRIVEINSDGTLQTKGDANARQLPFEMSIKPGQVHGKEIAIIPYLGWVKIGVTEYIVPNIVWLVAAVVLLYVLSILFKRQKSGRTGYKRPTRRLGGIA